MYVTKISTYTSYTLKWKIYLLKNIKFKKQNKFNIILHNLDMYRYVTYLLF